MVFLSALRDLAVVLVALSGLPTPASWLSPPDLEQGLGTRLSALEMTIAIEAYRRHIDPAIALGLVYQESRFRTTARSHTADYGLFQVHCGKDFSWCRRFRVRPQALQDPQTGIRVGLAVVANCKRRAAQCRGADCPHFLYLFNHSQAYVRSVLRHARRYRPLLRAVFPFYDRLT